MKTVIMLLLLSASAGVAQAPGDGAVIVTLRGSLSSSGKPVSSAQFFLAPADAQTAVAVDRAGKFEVKAMAARTYNVTIAADGYAPIQRSVEVDEKGAVELGVVKLDPLKTVKVTVAVGPRGSLKDAPPQKLDLRHQSCANVRAQDDSGCLLAFCVRQSGPALEVDRYSHAGQLHSLGKVSLADALGKLPRGGTFVTGVDDRSLTLNQGETVASDLADPYCAALVHVDEVR